jgi:hypothetical protein
MGAHHADFSAWCQGALEKLKRTPQPIMGTST